MSDITIKTNNHYRELLAAYELPEGILESEFDYLDPSEDNDELYSPRFFQYLGEWYDIQEFSVISSSESWGGWQGIQPDSYFSGVVVSYAPEEYCRSNFVVPYSIVKVGRYFS